jgi:CheY-like chemotaxis protein
MATSGKRPFRVLVVDDNQDAADTLAVLLNLWGYDCQVSYDGTTALREAQHFRPDCLLLDINMPGIDGCTVARRVRQMAELRDVQLVALTACSDQTDVQRIQEAGFDHHFVKPADIDKLEGLLKSMENVAKATEAKGVDKQISELKQEIREAKDRPGE